jgi:RNA methyltransferase, TrmH family
VIDGPTLVAAAIDAGLVLDEVFVTSGADSAVLAQAAASGAVVSEVGAETLARAVDTVSSQGIAAIAPRPEVSLDAALELAAAGPLCLVLVDVADPGNAGTLLRAAEAAGARAVLFCGSSVDPTNGKCVRASAGALFHLSLATSGDAGHALEGLARQGVCSLATVAHGGRPYDSVDLTGPIAIVLGNEAHGLPSAICSQVDERVTIPMAGRAESLNVAMAGSVLCFEALRQRRAQSIGDSPA